MNTKDVNKSQQELLKKIKELESQLKNTKKQKKYGLVWEDKPEEFEEKAKNALPILEAKKSGKWDIQQGAGLAQNILIEGDNYHSLSVLSYTHRGKVDVIYIDPPYNTGNKSWKYNNDYVEKDDSYWHSKWLSFMSKRLILAKKLLTDDGCLICAIDENEQAHLGVLLEEIFPTYEIHCISIVHNPRGIQGANFSYTHEYAFFIFPKGKKIIENRKISEQDISWRGLRDNGGESLRTDARSCFYPMIVKDGEIIGFGDLTGESIHPKQIENIDGCQYIYPIDKEGIERKWRYARQSINKVKHLLRVKNNEIQIGKDFGKYRTVWIDKLYDSNEYGSKLVSQITGTKFPFPKSLYNVKDCLYAIVQNRKKAVVLDFFAGSGTTGHAVLELNKEDGGNRQFIVCTNNENDICEEITYERLKRVMRGYKNPKGEEIEGLGGNLKYLKTEFLPRQNTVQYTDEDKLELTQKVGCMLALKENTFEETRKSGFYQTFESESQVTGIYFREDKGKLSEYIEQITQTEKQVKIYIFSWMKGEYKNAFSEYENLTCEDIPEPILEVYKSIGL